MLFLALPYEKSPSPKELWNPSSLSSFSFPSPPKIKCPIWTFPYQSWREFPTLLVLPAERKGRLYRLNSTFYNETKGISHLSIIQPKTPSAMKSNVYLHAEKRNYIYAIDLELQSATSRTRLTSRTWGPAKSSRTGMRSRSSLSWASENQLLIGTACWGWKM